MSATRSTRTVGRGDRFHALASAEESKALGSNEAERRNAAAEIDGRQRCEVIWRTSTNGSKRQRQRGSEVKAKLLNGSDGVAEDWFRRATRIGGDGEGGLWRCTGFTGGERGRGEDTKLGEQGLATVTVATAMRDGGGENRGELERSSLAARGRIGKSDGADTAVVTEPATEFRSTGAYAEERQEKSSPTSGDDASAVGAEERRVCRRVHQRSCAQGGLAASRRVSRRGRFK
ncbi:hypothetical protein E2562_018006 [Oryza meyeriana var. granulata]|uniref:DUF834 domain-containing protein n=1 Tax=Oryza meyeriana var. granulata TaxID=110450 RepID=A0A6G1F900_9ORYZ|nr:hypothetical protein E2562_018006 [Oryza meyeriana var. granulata]